MRRVEEYHRTTLSYGVSLMGSSKTYFDLMILTTRYTITLRMHAMLAYKTTKHSARLTLIETFSRQI